MSEFIFPTQAKIKAFFDKKYMNYIGSKGQYDCTIEDNSLTKITEAVKKYFQISHQDALSMTLAMANLDDDDSNITCDEMRRMIHCKQDYEEVLKNYGKYQNLLANRPKIVLPVAMLNPEWLKELDGKQVFERLTLENAPQGMITTLADLNTQKLYVDVTTLADAVPYFKEDSLVHLLESFEVLLEQEVLCPKDMDQLFSKLNKKQLQYAVQHLSAQSLETLFENVSDECLTQLFDKKAKKGRANDAN